MTRAEIIQRAIDACGGPDYVEIGVDEGATFKVVRAARKIAIDPEFRYDWTAEGKDNEEFFEMTSDEFFDSFDQGIDGVVYVDGLHTYEQSLRDIENVLDRMSDRSVILVDDCSPNSPSSASETMAESDGSWCGDVWKSIVHLRTTRQDLKIKTMVEFPGLAYIVFGEPDSVLEVDLVQLASAGYEYLDANSKELLNGE